MPLTIHVNSLFSTVVEQAIELSAQWHDQTYRKKRWRDAPFEVPTHEILRVPVIAHVTAVGVTVQRAGWDDETVAAAFLHDVLEDVNRFGQTMRAEKLREALGEGVLSRVSEVTEPQFDDEGQPRPWEDRKKRYLDQIQAGSQEAAAISLADKLHNLWSINQGLGRGIDVFTADEQGHGLSVGPDQQLWFHEAVVDATSGHDDPRLEPMRNALGEELERFRQSLS